MQQKKQIQDDKQQHQQLDYVEKGEWKDSLVIAIRDMYIPSSSAQVDYDASVNRVRFWPLLYAWLRQKQEGTKS
jgi:hypothetical protein